VRADGPKSVLVRLRDFMLDLDRPVRIDVNGRRAFEGPVRRTTAVLAGTLGERQGPGLVFAAEVRVAVPEGEKPVSQPNGANLTPADVRRAPAAVVPDGGAVRVVREWSGSVCRSKLVNDGSTPVRVKEVILFDIAHPLPSETHLYGEGFTMLWTLLPC